MVLDPCSLYNFSSFSYLKKRSYPFFFVSMVKMIHHYLLLMLLLLLFLIISIIFARHMISIHFTYSHFILQTQKSIKKGINFFYNSIIIFISDLHLHFVHRFSCCCYLRSFLSKYYFFLFFKKKRTLLISNSSVIVIINVRLNECV